MINWCGVPSMKSKDVERELWTLRFDNQSYFVIPAQASLRLLHPTANYSSQLLHTINVPMMYILT